MSRPRKTPAKDAAPAAAAAPTMPAFPTAPAFPQGQVPTPGAAPAFPGTAPAFPGAAPAANPAPTMFGAVQQQHPTANPAAVAPTVDLSKIEAKLDQLATAIAGFPNEFKALHIGLQEVLGKLSGLTAATAPAAPLASSAATQSAVAPAAPVAPTAGATTQAGAPGGIDPSQVALMVQGVRGMLAQHYGQNPGADVMVNNPQHVLFLAQAAQATGVQYLQGQDLNNPDLQKHVVDSLRAAGAIDGSGKVA